MIIHSTDLAIYNHCRRYYTQLVEQKLLGQQHTNVFHCEVCLQQFATVHELVMHTEQPDKTECLAHLKSKTGGS